MRACGRATPWVLFFCPGGTFTVAPAAPIETSPPAGQGCHKAASCTIIVRILYNSCATPVSRPGANPSSRAVWSADAAAGTDGAHAARGAGAATAAAGRAARPLLAVRPRGTRRQRQCRGRALGGGLGSKHAKSSRKEIAPKRPGPQPAKAPPKKKFKNETNGPCSR